MTRLALKDICLNICDGVHNTVIDTPNEKYYLLSAKNVKNGCIVISKGDRTISLETLEKLRQRTKLSKNDVVITTVGTIGEVALIPDNAINYEFQRSVGILKPNQEIINPRFLKYIMQSSSMNTYLINNATGAAQPCLFIGFLKKIKVEFPDLNIQDKIASVLSTYDDLIEKNNRKIQILQEMAEELYKEWFVRFRFPGHKTTKFIDGIPEGWEIKRMNDFCYVTDGTHDTPKPQIEGIPLVTGKCIVNGFIDFSLSYPISIEDHESIKIRSGLKSGDILFSNIGTVGTTCFVDYTREFSVKNVIIFKPESKLEGNYLYYWLNSKSIQETFSNQTNGASQQFVGLTFMRRFKILVPTNNILERFSKQVDNILQTITNLHNANDILKQQRDLLLPRLMSGKLEVKVS